ncbi:hypothetical protein NDU88_002419 [Pleurodeles waltl]|uniref:Uncharacterized protein n=1 Tax=Pleurodeles waltl TaxID=8319 RepID=A0AAV7RDA5_PLEWA|nr:hypothetical protein NDU88_002419 [Pleurodeles waltl]
MGEENARGHSPTGHHPAHTVTRPSGEEPPKGTASPDIPRTQRNAAPKQPQTHKEKLRHPCSRIGIKVGKKVEKKIHTLMPYARKGAEAAHR